MASISFKYYNYYFRQRYSVEYYIAKITQYNITRVYNKLHNYDHIP